MTSHEPSDSPELDSRNSEPVTPNPELVTPNPQPATNRLVIVTEDDEGLNRLICRRLERHGLATVGAHSGADAIAAVQEHPDCLLLLDYVLPDTDGHKVVEELVARGRPVPFIVMTGHGDERVAVEMMKLGARDYVVKQVDFIDLLVPVVERVLAQIATEERLGEAEKALRESEEKYRNVVERANDGIIIVREGILRFANQPMAKLMDSSVERLLGTRLSEHVHPDEVPQLMELNRRRIAGEGSSSVCETILRRADGSTVTVETSVGVVPFEGRPANLIVVRDITERKRAEQALKETEAEFRSIFDSANDGMMLVDGASGRFLRANRSCLKMLGYTDEEFAWLRVPDLHPKEDLPKVIREIERFLAGNAGRRADTRFRRKDGSSFDADVVPAGMRLQGRDCVLFVFRDITERKRAEEALRVASQRWQTTFDGIEDAICILAPEGTIIQCNTAMERLTGKKMTELTGTSCCEAIHGATNPPADCPLAKVRKTLVRERADLGLGDRYIEVTVDPLLDASGTLTGAVHIVADITGRKRAEEELRTAFEEIRLLQEQLEAENVYLRKEIKLGHVHGDIVGESPAIKQTLALGEQVAPTDSTVLIYGETGTGKELLAHFIHNLSPRKDRPLVTVNCAAMPSELIESELFGREKGAYTGALSRQAGRFEVADKSTLFLDEVGELSPGAQVKLLRVLQEGKFERLGSSDTTTVDVRIIAATNRDLERRVKDGRFHDDLFYRLNVFPITIPPLRERREDIPLLVWTFVREFSEKMGKHIETIPKKTMEALSSQPWPGNVRALRNTIERAMILSTGTTLHVELPDERPGASLPTRIADDDERGRIMSALERAGWRIRGKDGAAEQLGLKPTTLEYRIKRLGIRRPEDKSC